MEYLGNVYEFERKDVNIDNSISYEKKKDEFKNELACWIDGCGLKACGLKFW